MTPHPPSAINGELHIEKGAELIIDDQDEESGGNAVAITGEGEIEGPTTGGSSAGIISTADNDELTIYHPTSTGCDASTILTVHGLLTISAKLVNNAHIIADNGTLTLSAGGKSGDDGCYKAKGSAKLQINSCTISGANDWELTDNMDAEIEFTSSATATSLTGDFTITKGTLDVDTGLNTTGHLTFESTGGSNPRIEVANEKWAYFGGS